MVLFMYFIYSCCSIRFVLGEEFNISWRMLFIFVIGSININILESEGEYIDLKFVWIIIWDLIIVCIDGRILIDRLLVEYSI